MLTNRYLIDERPLTVLPTLVGALGFPGAAIVQQIHWLCQQPNSGRVLEDGQKWVWGTHDEWCELYFSFWESDTLRKHLVALEKGKIILSCQPKAKDWDRTKHYRVNVEMVNAYIEKYLEKKAKKAEKPDSERTGMNMPHRSGKSSESNRHEHDASNRHEHATSKRHEHATSNRDEHAGSYKEQNVLTEPTTEPAAELRAHEAEKWDDPEVFELLRFKLNHRNPAAAGKLEECLLEKPLRHYWRSLTLAQAQDALRIADDLYRNKGKAFVYEFIKKLDDIAIPKPESQKPPPPDEEEGEIPQTLEERQAIAAKTNSTLPPNLQRSLAAREAKQRGH